MRILSHAVRLCAAVLLGLVAGGARAEDPALSKTEGDEIQRVADQIDALLAKRWKEIGITPASAASDAELFRRMYLHLGGSIPPVSDVREYLASDSPDKHRAVVDRLLDGPGYIIHFTRYWRQVMLPET